MSDSPSERENLTAALVRDYDDEQLVVWIHALQDREEALEDEVERASLNSKLQSRLARRALHKFADLEDEVEQLRKGLVAEEVISDERDRQRNVLEARVTKLQAHLDNAREDWRTVYARLEVQDARVAELDVETKTLAAMVIRGDEENERLHARVTELEAIRGVFVRDNRDKTNAVRELQAALAGVLRSYEAYEMLCDPFPRDEYNAVMIPAWRLAASLVPGFDVRAMTPWVEAAALAAEKGETT